MTLRAFPFRHTRTRTIITGSTRLVAQAAIEKGCSLEIVLWDGVIVRRIDDEQVAAIKSRTQSISSNRYLQWTEEQWNKRGLTLQRRTNIDIQHKENSLQRWKLIPVLLQGSKAL